MSEINKILDDFQEKFGINPRKPKELKVISTGYKALDDALGTGGIPQGKTTEISGESDVGKTILAYQIIAEAQKKGLIALYVDAERNLSREYAKKMGIKLNELMVCLPVTGEMAFSIIAYYIENSLVDLIVIDSLPALISLTEAETLKGDYKLQERMIGNILRFLMDMIDETDVSLVCLNQIRTDLKTKKSIVPFNKFMGYYASVRMRLSRLKTITKWRRTRGFTVEADIHKNNFNKRAVASYDVMLKEE